MPDDPLPSLGELVSGWLGFRLPSIPLPQTIKNLDKAVGKLLLAASENAEAKIKANTGTARAKGKIAIEGLYRTDEEKRKVENRAAAISAAIEDMNSTQQTTDAEHPIDDDWLNLFARLSEDKSSEELRNLFGRILSGEIRRPGSFSLRTIQFVSTLSREDAQAVSHFLSFALGERFVPSLTSDTSGPNTTLRVQMEELGLASNPNQLGGLSWQFTVEPKTNSLLHATQLGIMVQNNTDHPVRVVIPCQVLSKPAQELIRIANPSATDLQYLKDVAQVFFEDIRSKHADELIGGKINIVVGLVMSVGNRFALTEIYKASMTGQSST